MDPINGFGGIPFPIVDPRMKYGVRDADLDTSPTIVPIPPDLPAGDIGAQVAAMVVVNASRNKATAQQLRKSELAMQRVAEDREIQAMRKAAELAVAKAVVSAVAAGIDGALMIGAAPAKPGASGAPAPKSGGEKGGGFAKECLAIAENFLAAEAKYKDIDAERYKQEAGHHKDAAAEAKDMVDDAKKLADKAIDFYSQWTQGKASAMQAALHRS